ncbi:MAG: hypothetical protein ABW048_08310, partial [Sphingobium sp.]
MSLPVTIFPPINDQGTMTAEQEPTTITPPPAPRRGIGTRMILGLVILAFIGGALLMTWLSQNWPAISGKMSASRMAQNGADPMQNAVAALDPSTPSTRSMLAAPALVDAQAARIVDLEQRLSRISIAAQAASYNANRSEALLVAFAARRALDAGRPLGYVEGILRLRFGDAQPRAVATIVNAASRPVTLADLRLALQDIAPVGRDPRENVGWWQRFWREVSSVAIIRKAGAPSPEPEQRLMRARHAVELGQVDQGIAELSALPPQSLVTRWLELARRYNEAHRALDVIEAAAILEPRTGVGPVPAPAEPLAGSVTNEAQPEPADAGE